MDVRFRSPSDADIDPEFFYGMRRMSWDDYPHCMSLFLLVGIFI